MSGELLAFGLWMGLTTLLALLGWREGRAGRTLGTAILVANGLLLGSLLVFLAACNGLVVGYEGIAETLLGLAVLAAMVDLVACLYLVELLFEWGGDPAEPPDDSDQT